jgi:hypothetical protein
MATEYKEVRKKGPSGKAEVRAIKDTLKIIFEDNPVPFEFIADEYPYKILTGKNLYVALSADESNIIAIRPYAGTYPIRFFGFTHQEGEPPTYKEEAARIVNYRDKNTGQQKSFPAPARLVFFSLLEIVSEPEAGICYPFKVPYAVDRNAQTGNMMIAGAPGDAKAMRVFMEMWGYDFMNDEIPFSSNILPDLEEILKGNDILKLVNVEAGWINRDAFSNLPPGYKPETKKAAAKKAPAKKAKK